MSAEILPPPRPGDAAIVEEFRMAEANSTPRAMELFIARHPTHPLAGVARERRKAMDKRLRR